MPRTSPNRSNRSNPKRLLNKCAAAEERRVEASKRVEAIKEQIAHAKKLYALHEQALALAQKRLALLQAASPPSSTFQVIDLTDQSEEDPK